MKRFLLFVMLLASPAMVGCRVPSTIVTPAGKSAYDADQVVLRLTELSNIVKADVGTAPGQIAARDAFTVIEWISGDDKHKDAMGNLAPTVGVVQIVQTTSGQGWKTAAKDGWTKRIRAIVLTYPHLANYVPIIDALVEVV